MGERPDLKYLPQYCPFLKREVWAIVVKQADGSWQIVNCLDKDHICYDQGCAFTIDGGQWPFQSTWLSYREERGRDDRSTP